MTNRIDHEAEALSALEGSGDGRNFATDASVVALVHAALALMEQQRIANLIALGYTTEKTGVKKTERSLHRSIPDFTYEEVRLRRDIAAALHIEEEA